MIVRFVKALLALCVIGSVLTGCDVESNYDEGGIGGSGLIIGRVTNAENLHIEGKSLSMRDSTIIRNSMTFSEETAQFHVGEYVIFSAESLPSSEVVRTIEYSAPVIGPVTQPTVSPNGFVVAGQRVQMTELVVFSGVSELSSLDVGEFVEISGYRDTDDVLHATRLVKLANNEINSNIRLVGPVRVLGRDSFMIGGATINTSTLAAGEGLSLQDLEEGVEVSVAARSSTESLIFDAIRLSSVKNYHLGEEGSQASIAGLSTDYTGLDQPFTINGIDVVITQSTILDNGTMPVAVSSINVNAADPLSGSTDFIVHGTVNTQGQLVATSLIFLPAAGLTEFSGTVDLIDESDSSLIVGGISVVVDAITLFANSDAGLDPQENAQNPEDDTISLVLSDLSVGDQVRVIGIQNTDSSIYARQLLRLQQ